MLNLTSMNRMAIAMKGRRWVPGIVVLGLGLAAVALGGGSQLAQTGRSEPTPTASSSDVSPSPTVPPSLAPSHYPEVVSYANEFGLSLEEAGRRSEIQNEIETGPLRQAMGSRWAGGWVEHEPEFHYVVRLTGRGWQEFVAIVADWPLPVVFIDGATHGEKEFLAAMEKIDDRLHEEFPRMGMYPDLKSGAILLQGPDAPSAEFLAQLESLGGVPVRYEYSPGEWPMAGMSPTP